MLVICNGMPRAGSTLQYNLARTLVERLGLGQGAGFFVSSSVSEQRMHDWAADSTTTVIKMHELHPATLRLLARSDVALCYVHRDLRAVAASARKKWDLMWPDLIALLTEAVSVYEALTQAPGVLEQRYTELVEDSEATIQQLARFLGIQASDEVVAEVAAMCSLASSRAVMEGFSPRERVVHRLNKLGSIPHGRLRIALRKAGIGKLVRRLGIRRATYDPRTLLHLDHISAVSSADWRIDLTVDEISEIELRFTEFLASAGYLAS